MTSLTSLCVPCIPRDIHRLPTLLNSVVNQTLLPLETIIAISGITSEQAVKLQEELSTITPVRIISVETMQYAGPNRNLASKHAIGKYVSFMDADDQMHHQRIELIQKAFEANPTISGIFHHHSPQLSTSTYDKYKLTNDRSNGVHNGHGSFKKEIFDEIQYNDKQRAQDLFFNRWVCSNKVTKTIQLPLSQYVANARKNKTLDEKTPIVEKLLQIISK